MVDPFAIAALIVAISSALFVGIVEGGKLISEYRESETTLKRKREIDDKLHEEVKKKLEKLVEMSNLKKQKEEELFKKTEELGHCSYLARSMTGQILDKMAHSVKSAFAWLLFGLFVLFVTLVLVVTLLEGSFLSPQLWFIGFFLVGSYFIPLVVCFARTIRRFSNYYFLRGRFLRLYENPSLEYGQKLYGELKEKNLW